MAAFASGATGAALAGPATGHAAANRVGPASAVDPASPQDLVGPQDPASPMDPASLVSPASLGSLVSPADAARGSIVLLAAARTPRQIAQAMMPSFHWSVRRQFKYLNWLWARESGWNKHAYDPYSGAYGIPQALPGSKMASAGPNWRSNAATQIRWGLRYIKARYGSPRRAWGHSQANGWY